VRYAARRDSSERPIVTNLRKCGVEVTYISTPKGPDLLCYFQGKWTPLGCKPEKYARLTKAEKKGVRWPLVSTFAEAARWIGIQA
jgi:hypothetical protein